MPSHPARTEIAVARTNNASPDGPERNPTRPKRIKREISSNARRLSFPQENNSMSGFDSRTSARKERATVRREATTVPGPISLEKPASRSVEIDPLRSSPRRENEEREKRNVEIPPETARERKLSESFSRKSPEKTDATTETVNAGKVPTKNPAIDPRKQGKIREPISGDFPERPDFNFLTDLPEKRIAATIGAPPKKPENAGKRDSSEMKRSPRTPAREKKTPAKRRLFSYNIKSAEKKERRAIETIGLILSGRKRRTAGRRRRKSPDEITRE